MNSSIQTQSGRFNIRNFLFNGILFVVLVFSAVSQGHADGYRDRGNSEWRLGEHYRIYHRTDRGWHRVPGSATDVGDGWVIGTDRRDGGYGIYRWNGYGFDRMPGAAVEIGGSYDRPWVVNNRGEHFEWTGRNWREIRSSRGYRDDRHNQWDEHRGNEYRGDRRSRW